MPKSGKFIKYAWKVVSVIILSMAVVFLWYSPKMLLEYYYQSQAEEEEVEQKEQTVQLPSILPPDYTNTTRAPQEMNKAVVVGNITSPGKGQQESVASPQDPMPLASVYGRVALSDGRLPVRAKVKILDSGGQLLIKTKTNKKGKYSFTQVPLEAKTIVFLHEGYLRKSFSLNLQAGEEIKINTKLQLFIQADHLKIDLRQLELRNRGKTITNIYLKNRCEEKMAIDKIKISWRADEGEMIESVYIGRNTFWSYESGSPLGKQPSGTILDGNDQKIGPKISKKLKMSFDQNMRGKRVRIKFGMVDGSTKTVEFDT